MRKPFWITLLSLALALSVYSSGAGAATMPMHGDCCETMCHDMPACASMVLCQACTTSIAHPASHPPLASARREAFAPSGHDRFRASPAPKIWNPPD